MCHDITWSVLLHIICRYLKLITSHYLLSAQTGECCNCLCLCQCSGVSPPCLSRQGELSSLPLPQARSVVEISSSREKSASPGEGLMLERLIADYGAAACWEHTLLGGSNIFISIHTNTDTHTQAQSPCPPRRQDPSACWIPDEHQPCPPPPPPREALLLCLQVALLGIRPTASRFHVAKGIILPFVCVGVYGLH